MPAKRKGPIPLSNLTYQSQYGLYQIHGPHYSYGSQVLLYIGQAWQQPFSIRILQHGWQHYERSDEIYVFCGFFRDINGSMQMDAAIVNYIEQLLIYVHAPSANSQCILDPDVSSEKHEQLKKLRIFNWGNHGGLLPEVSGLRWLTSPPRL